MYDLVIKKCEQLLTIVYKASDLMDLTLEIVQVINTVEIDIMTLK
jgi:hypothetical protein